MLRTVGSTNFSTNSFTSQQVQVEVPKEVRADTPQLDDGDAFEGSVRHNTSIAAPKAPAVGNVGW